MVRIKYVLRLVVRRTFTGYQLARVLVKENDVECNVLEPRDINTSISGENVILENSDTFALLPVSPEEVRITGRLNDALMKDRFKKV